MSKNIITIDLSKNIITIDQSENTVVSDQSEYDIVNEPTKKIITITRKWQTEFSTISEIQFDESSFGYTLEPPGPDTTEVDKNKRIPTGTYNLKWHTSEKLSLAKHNPLPLLYNDQVSEDRGILIHHGRYPKDTEGCLLAGSARGVNTVEGSVPKLKEIQAYLKKIDIKNCMLVIESDF